MGIEFRILGPLEIVRDGRALLLGGRKQRSLVALLVLHAGEFLSSDRLIEELWRESESGAAARLQVYVSQLRKALGENASALQTRPGGYELAVSPEAVDANRFERLAGEGREALAAGDAEAAARTLRGALAMWRGPALGELAYEPLAERAAARLEELRVVAREDRIEADLALGRDRELVAELEQLIGEHPLRERLRGQLMVALYRCGRQADALRAYREARSELAEEGLEPGPELEALQTAILRQDPALVIVTPEARAGRRAPASSVLEGRWAQLQTLLEREAFLETLEDYLEESRNGHGRFVFLGGEAGVGKTALLERFAETHRDSARVLTGACDGTATPRPLGPLFDMLPELRDRWAGPGAEDMSRQRLFEGLLEELARGPAPSVLLFEDVHWADEATLDLLRYLARRVSKLPCFCVASYRDDEVGRDHPLTVVLGDAATLASTRRMTLPRLSGEGVAVLARDSGIDARELHQLTGGNAFFVSEVIAAASSAAPGQAEVPPTVRDAVLARAARLSPPARRALDAASIIGLRVEPWLLERILPGEAEPVDECVERGMLRSEGGMIAFRHELARLTVEDNVPAIRRIALHRAVFEALAEAESGDDEAARLAHHAEAAGEGRAVLAFAPIAAQRAAQLGAHREAAEQYRRALRFTGTRFAGTAPEQERAELLERLSIECYLTDQVPEAIESRRQVLAAWRLLGDQTKVGESLRWLSRLSWFDGRNADAERHGAEAVRVLEPLLPGRELAYAYSNISQLRMLSQKVEEAVAWGERAIALAEELDEVEVLCHALGNVGTSLLNAERVDEGHAFLERSLELARRADLHDHVARAYVNLTSGFVQLRRYDQADAYFGPAMEYCAERDLDSMGLYLDGWLARSHLEQGRWDAAMRSARAGLRHPLVSPVTRITPLVVLGLLRARRGTPDPWEPLDEALALAEPTGELQRMVPVAAARAEAAWLEGDIAREAPLVARALDQALALGSSWNVGVLAYWMWRCGELDRPPERGAEPFALQMAGRWVEAAERWAKIGCPYERATALAEVDDEASLRQAVDELSTLGAGPAARRATDRMRGLGLRVPRGPRATTMANPAHLTSREVGVLDLLEQGLSNADIAARLFISEKTAAHHVSAILAKLGVRTRSEAGSVARRVGAARTKAET
ncbi:MAG: BTAD domain-containing putative transcriptional regulator [Actinomycetota bacterium]